MEVDMEVDMQVDSEVDMDMGRRDRGPGPGGGRSGVRRGGFWFGALEALLVPLCFVALGLAWWGVAVRAQAGGAAYPGSMRADAELWLIDGFNVLQVALLSGRDRSEWWTARYRAELLEHAGAFHAGAGSDAELWVAFDGDRAAGDGEGPVRAVFVPSADDWMVARVRAASDPARVRVVTADRRLAARVRHLGAEVVSPGAFLGLCGVPEATSNQRGETTTL